MIGITDALFANGAEVDCFGESIAFCEEVLVVWFLVAVWAEMDAEIFVGFICFVDGNGDSRGVG